MIKKLLKLCVVGVLTVNIVGTVLTVSAAVFPEFKTWSHVMTGISATFEAGHKGTGDWGTDPNRIITQSWVGLQEKTNGTVEFSYSPKVETSSVGQYGASKEKVNNPFTTMRKYYGWYY